MPTCPYVASCGLMWPFHSPPPKKIIATWTDQQTTISFIRTCMYSYENVINTTCHQSTTHSCCLLTCHAVSNNEFHLAAHSTSSGKYTRYSGRSTTPCSLKSYMAPKRGMCFHTSTRGVTLKMLLLILSCCEDRTRWLQDEKVTLR